MKAFLNWSGGKDSALSLYTAREQGIPVEALVTTVSKTSGRITMHGVSRELLEAQAQAIGLPLYLVELEEGPCMEAYENAIHAMNLRLRNEGFTHVISGDLFLQDLRQYRESLYSKDGIACIFPLWELPLAQLEKTYLVNGFKAITVAVNGSLLDAGYCGKQLDEDFFNSLPPGVDRFGENGEYHSFTWDGPVFRHPLQVRTGELVSKDYPAPKKDDCFTEPSSSLSFWFCELS